MRQMSDGKQTVKVKRHIIVRNFWEYFIIEPDKDGFETVLPEHPTRNDNNPVQFAYVMGHFDEFGDVNLEELVPYIITDTIHLRREEVAPPPGWKWID